jgi:hypothetical protein
MSIFGNVHSSAIVPNGTLEAPAPPVRGFFISTRRVGVKPYPRQAVVLCHQHDLAGEGWGLWPERAE